MRDRPNRGAREFLSNGLGETTIEAEPVLQKRSIPGIEASAGTNLGCAVVAWPVVQEQLTKPALSPVMSQRGIASTPMSGTPYEMG